MAGDDVPNKKPDPSIYKIAADRLQVDPAECLVIEDSTIGLQVSTKELLFRVGFNHDRGNMQAWDGQCSEQLPLADPAG